jgi:hypothetical protein
MHHEEVKEPLMCAECRLLHIVGRHEDLVIAGAKVQLSEEPCPLQFIKQLIYDRNWILVFHCDGVRSATSRQPS